MNPRRPSQFVPLITVTALVFLSYASVPGVPEKAWAPLVAAVPTLLPTGVNLGTAVALAVGAFYLFLTPSLLGLALLAYFGALYLAAQHWRLNAGENGLTAAIALHVVSWLAQFYGHGVHEGRAPALLDNLVQALVMAPGFVFMEALFGLGLLKGLQAEAAPIVAAKISAWRATKAASESKRS